MSLTDICRVNRRGRWNRCSAAKYCFEFLAIVLFTFREQSPSFRVGNREVRYIAALPHVLTVQPRIAMLAQRSPDFAFFPFAYYIDLEWFGLARVTAILSKRTRTFSRRLHCVFCRNFDVFFRNYDLRICSKRLHWYEVFESFFVPLW